MKRFALHVLRLFLTVIFLLGLVVLGNLISSWVWWTAASTPPQTSAPRAWTFDPFHNYTREA
jgi:hypothetical protein